MFVYNVQCSVAVLLWPLLQLILSFSVSLPPSLQVTLVHVNAIAKNAADDKLRQSLRRFAHTYPAPSTVVLISGDVNFSSELTDLRHVHNITIVLVHNPQASQALKVFAHKLIDFYEFLEDVEPPQQPQVRTCILHIPSSIAVLLWHVRDKKICLHIMLFIKVIFILLTKITGLCLFLSCYW